MHQHQMNQHSLVPLKPQPFQQIVGSLLYYARAIDCTLLPALNTISRSQAKPTQATKQACKILLDYCATFPHVVLSYKASDKI